MYKSYSETESKVSREINELRIGGRAPIINMNFLTIIMNLFSKSKAQVFNIIEKQNWKQYTKVVWESILEQEIILPSPYISSYTTVMVST